MHFTDISYLRLLNEEIGIVLISYWTIIQQNDLFSLFSSNECSPLFQIYSAIPSFSSIEEDSFSFYSLLTEISIPESATSVGNRAFFNCISLAELLLSSSANHCHKFLLQLHHLLYQLKKMLSRDVHHWEQ